MKKLLAVLMALVLMMCSVAFAGAVDPDYIADTMTSEDGNYELAFVTDVGQLKDKSLQPGHLEWRKGLRRRNMACPTSTISPPTATRRPTTTATTP